MLFSLLETNNEVNKIKTNYEKFLEFVKNVQKTRRIVTRKTINCNRQTTGDSFSFTQSAKFFAAPQITSVF